jgi:hypothetical protein
VEHFKQTAENSIYYNFWNYFAVELNPKEFTIIWKWILYPRFTGKFNICIYTLNETKNPYKCIFRKKLMGSEVRRLWIHSWTWCRVVWEGVYVSKYKKGPQYSNYWAYMKWLNLTLQSWTGEEEKVKEKERAVTILVAGFLPWLRRFDS